MAAFVIAFAIAFTIAFAILGETGRKHIFRFENAETVKKIHLALKCQSRNTLLNAQKKCF